MLAKEARIIDPMTIIPITQANILFTLSRFFPNIPNI